MRLRLLLLGSLPPPAGGTTLLFQQLVSGLASRSDLELRAVDTAARGALFRARSALRIVAALPRCDVVSLHASPPGIAQLGPRLLSSGRPLVVRVFGGTLDAGDSSAQRARLTRVLDGAARVLVETDQLAAWLSENHARARVDVLRNSRPLPEAPPAPPPGAKRFVFLGQVCDAKGVPELARAMEIAAASGATLDVYGDAPDAALRALLERTPGVRVRGPVENARVPALLAAADALVLPTRHPGEGHPGVVIEALMAGRAVIAARHRAVPEVVEQERTGLLVPAGDAAALGAAITRLACEPQLSARLGAAGWARAAEFDAARWTERFVAICREVAAEM